MPWLNELPEDQLARQHCTLACYLGLLREGMPWRAVHRQLLAYLRGTLRRILARRGGGAAAGQPEAAGASPVTTPSGAPSGEGDPPHHLPASGSEPSLHAAAGAAGAAAAGVTGDSGTPRGPGSGKPGSGGKLPATT